MSESLLSAVKPYLRGYWWLVLLRAVLAVLFGVLLVAQPGASIVTFTWVFGVFAVVDGIFDIVFGIVWSRRDSEHQWGWEIATGVASLILGVLAVIFPAQVGVVGVLMLLWLVILQALVGGITGIVAAIDLRGSIAGWGWQLAASIISLVLALWLLYLTIATPVEALLSFVWAIGVFTIALGIALAVFLIVARTSLGKAFRGDDSQRG